MEYKTSLPASVKDIDGRTVIGIFSTFGIVDAGADRVSKGAFKKTMREGMKTDRIKHLWQHDSWMPPIALVTNVQEVDVDALPRELRGEDVTGGAEVHRTYLRNERAQEVFEGIEAKAITQMSFAYDAVKYDFEEVEVGETSMMVRNLKELRLWETSDVLWGMNENTSASKRAIPHRKSGHSYEAWQKPVLSDFTHLSWSELSLMERNRIASHFAFSETRDLQKFEDLRFAHHAPSIEGLGPVVASGLTDALKGLFEVQGGSFGADLLDIYGHLAAHHEELGFSLPSVEVFKLYQIGGDVLAKYPTTLSGTTQELVHALREDFNTLLLGSDEPTGKTSTLARERNELMRRILQSELR
jgi:HK97 family phage prohead protease